MIKAEIFLTRPGGGSGDDIIKISECSASHHLFGVTYRAPDYANRKRFVLSESRVIDYVEDILRSLQHDSDPFEFVQISTPIHPSILYHVSDMDNSATRDLVITMIRMAMRADVETIE